jgi:hypothetical protein
VHWSLAAEAGTVELADAVWLTAVVEDAGAVVEGGVVFGFVVAAGEPHPSAIIPAIGISASRLMDLMAPSGHTRSGDSKPLR